MARIRSVKPELRTSLTAAEWPREVRYFWVLLWGYLDDHGYGQDEPRIIKGDCFPMDDDLTAGDVDKWLDLMAASGSVCRFRGSDGRRYLHAPNWAEHQRPQHPARPRMPSCPYPSHPHETFMSESHETVMRPSGEAHETTSPNGSLNGELAGQHTSHEDSGGSHETLTPEGEQGAGSREREQVAPARTRAVSTLLGNSLLDEHKRLIKPSLPRDVARRVGEEIDNLLDDPVISPDEIAEGLAVLRKRPELGPRVLPGLVHEIRQVRAHPELGRRGRAPDWRQQETDELFNAAARRMAQSEGTS
jgi:hypothetical protein